MSFEIYFTCKFFILVLKALAPSIVIANYMFIYMNVVSSNNRFFFFKSLNLNTSYIRINSLSYLKLIDLFVILLVLFSQMLSIGIHFHFYEFLPSFIITIFMLLMSLSAYLVFSSRVEKSCINGLITRTSLLASFVPIVFFGSDTSWFSYLFALEFLTITCIWFLISTETNNIDHVLLYVWAVISSAFFLNMSILMSVTNNFFSAFFFVLFITLKLGIFPFGFWVINLYTKLSDYSFYTYLIFFYLQITIMTYFFSFFFLHCFAMIINDLIYLYIHYMFIFVLSLNTISIFFIPMCINERIMLVFNTWGSSAVVLLML